MSGMKSFLGFHCQTPLPEKWKLFSQAIDNKRIISFLREETLETTCRIRRYCWGFGTHPRTLGVAKGSGARLSVGRGAQTHVTTDSFHRVSPWVSSHHQKFPQNRGTVSEWKNRKLLPRPLETTGKKVSCPSRGFPPGGNSGFPRKFPTEPERRCPSKYKRVARSE